MLDVRETLTAALEDQTVLYGWQITLDGERPEAREAHVPHLKELIEDSDVVELGEE